MPPDASPPPLFLDAAIRPRRSLSRRGVMLLMIPFVLVNLIFATFFLVIGGAFVPPFLGLDVLGLGLALWFNFRSARRIERVRVSAEEIAVTRERGDRIERVWASAPVFTRVELSHPGRHASRLRLQSKGKGVVLAASLSPEEREKFAAELRNALEAARAARW
jgi:uncharacterized membrane protein